MAGTTTITVRHVPDEVRNELAARAARSGRSLQEFMLGEVTRLAAQPSIEELVDEIRARKRATGTRADARAIVAAVAAGRR